MRCGDQISLLLHSCLGPRGRPKLLSPSSVITSSSYRLLPLLGPPRSLFARVVLRGARGHLSSFGDGGLSCAALALRLLASNHPSSSPLVVGSLYEHFAAEFLRILETEVSFDVDFGELLPLRSVVRTLLSSKPLCSLSQGDSEALCSLVLRVFLEAAEEVGVEGRVGLAPTHSKVVSGIVVPLAEEDDERIRGMLSVGAGPFRACLFVCSLAGEVDWPAEVLVSKKAEVESASLRHLSSVVEEVMEAGVRVFLCQKVVHPRLKKRLQAAKMVVLDRLGGESATRIRSVLGERSGDLWYGTLSRPKVECVGRSRFLVLSSPDTPQLRSLLITHHNQEALAELEVVCRQSLSALFRLLVRPRVCFGGGCSEITAALLLSNKVRDNLDSFCSETNCTKGHVLSSMESFVRSVAHFCTSIHQRTPADFCTDSDSGHLWQQCPPTNRCACGSRDASSVRSWTRLTDIAGLGNILLTYGPHDVHPLSTSSVSANQYSSLVASTSDDSLVPSVPQNAFTSCDLPLTIQTSRLVPQNASISAPQIFIPLEQNTHKGTNLSMPDSTCQDILLDVFGCKWNSVSVAFEISIMLLKTTECIHTTPLATAEKVKVDDSVFSC